jgi:hypothetical protein
MNIIIFGKKINTTSYFLISTIIFIAVVLYCFAGFLVYKQLGALVFVIFLSSFGAATINGIRYSICSEFGAKVLPNGILLAAIFSSIYDWIL